MILKNSDISKGIVYFVWGDYNEGLLDRSIESVKKFGYNHSVVIDRSKNVGLAKRCNLFDCSPYDLTLFLDIDTIVKNNIDFGFEMAKKYGIACCIAPASSSYYAADNDAIKELIPVDLPQYNCGVIFCDRRNGDVKKVFGSYSFYLSTYQKYASKNDQPYFSYSLYNNWLNPYVLPKTWNFRHHLRFESEVYHGDLKIIHSKQDIRC